MPGDNDVNQQAAEQTVFDNLGMSREELGVDSEQDLGLDGDEGESGEEQGQQQPERQAPPERDEQEIQPRTKDDLTRRVSHTEQQEKPQPFRNAPVKPDKQGNLRDQHGNIVARAGKESRLYTDAHNAKVEVQRTRMQVQEINSRLEKAINIGQQLHGELEQLKGQQEQMRQLGLEPSEMLDAMQLAAMAKKDPQQALKQLLTRAAMQGIDLTQLGMQGGMDVKSISEALRAEMAVHLKPVSEQARKAEEQKRLDAEDTEAKQAVESEVRTFFSENPDALAHGEVFKRVLQQYPKMSLGEVWARIQLNLMRQPPQRQNRQQPSLPNGRGGPQGGRSPEIAAPDMSYDDIIREALKGI